MHDKHLQVQRHGEGCSRYFERTGGCRMLAELPGGIPEIIASLLHEEGAAAFSSVSQQLLQATGGHFKLEERKHLYYACLDAKYTSDKRKRRRQRHLRAIALDYLPFPVNPYSEVEYPCRADYPSDGDTTSDDSDCTLRHDPMCSCPLCDD